MEGVSLQNPESKIPESYTKQSSNSKVLFINKGQLNKAKVRPHAINEHVESSRSVIGTVSSGNIVGQIFKASQDNINQFGVTMESAAGVAIDNFESYANSAALQIEWVKGGTNEAELETTIVKSGTKSMRLPTGILVDDWVNTITATDYTGYTFDLNYQQDDTFGNVKVALIIGDGTNTKSLELAVEDKDSWHHFDINEAAMVDDGVTTPDMTAITKIGFIITKKKAGKSGYVDDLMATPPPGSIRFKLWDFGVTLPTDDLSTLGDSTQYTELGDRGINGGAVAAFRDVDLVGGKRDYIVPGFQAGIALEILQNTPLTVGNYYAVTIEYVDTDVNIYGPDLSLDPNEGTYYNNGFSFTVPDEVTAISATGVNEDIQFQIISTVDAYVEMAFQIITDSTGAIAVTGNNSTVKSHVEDRNMKVTSFLAAGTPTAPEITVDLKSRPVFVEKGGKFENYLNDDLSDNASFMGLIVQYVYEPPTING